MIKKLLFLLLFPIAVFAQNDHRLSSQEKAMMPSYLRTIANNRFQNFTQPPASPARASAEWEEIDALMIAWTSFPTILTEIARAAQAETKVLIICSDSNTVKTALTSASVPLTNIRYIIAPFNSIWCRDYGQWNIYTNDVDSLALIDWIYNRPRPKDDTVPSAIQRYTSLPMYQTTVSPNDLIHTGGNFMCDGLGTGFSSHLIIDENLTHTEPEIDTIMKKFMGINRYIKMTALPFDVIHHIDMHIKLLDEETLLVGQYPAGVADGPGIEANLQYILNNFQSPFGTPYKVIRIPMPPDATGTYPDQNGDYRTYTNSVFVNKTIILPTYSQQYDTTAIRIYREAFPGYTITGINCNSIIPSLGAIHCITKEVAAADPLLISHQPLHDTTQTTGTYAVVARIQHRSGINTASIFYRSDTLQPYVSTPMNALSTPDNTWIGSIPAYPGGTTIYYYIEASSNSGKTQVRPIAAPTGYWKFRILLNTGITNAQFVNQTELKNTYPNPAHEIIYIPVHTSSAQQICLTLKNILGETIREIYFGISSGDKNYFINCSELSPAVYFITLQSENAIQTKRIVVE